MYSASGGSLCALTSCGLTCVTRSAGRSRPRLTSEHAACGRDRRTAQFSLSVAVVPRTAMASSPSPTRHKMMPVLRMKPGVVRPG